MTDLNSDCKISYISDQRLPAQKANSEQIMNTISALAAQGADIELLVPGRWSSFFTAKNNFKQDIFDFYHLEQDFPVKQIARVPFATFQIDKVTHGILAPLYAICKGSKIIYTRNSLPAMVAHALGRKVIFEVFRIYEKNKKNAVKKLARLTNTSTSIIIITHSQPSRESLLAAGANESRVRVIHNGFNPQPLTPMLSKTEARKLLGWQQKGKYACFAGRIDVNKGANLLLELAQRNSDVTFVLIGYSEDDDENWIVRAAEERNLTNIKKLPWVTIGNLAKYLFASDILLIPPTADPLMQFGNTVLPIKTFVYMAASRAILAPALPDIKTVLNDNNAVLVEPDNVAAAQKAITKIFAETEWAKALAAKARNDARNYTWDSRAKKIINFVNETLLAN